MSNETSEITVGCKVIVKVGKHEIPATVLEIGTGCWLVKSLSTNKEFSVGKIIRVIPADEPAKPEIAREEAGSANTEKKMSLLAAAVEVLKNSDHPMNTRELVQVATERGYWIPTSCKTPEQTLYGSIFREIAMKEFPRIVKSEQKGKFRLA